MLRGALDGATIWWVAQTYKSVTRQIWPDLKRALANAWSVKSEVDHYIGLPSGGSVTVKSADDPDNLRGFGLDGVVIDEAAFCTEDLWSKILRPMLVDRNGWAMFITTPNGPNWLFDIFRRAQGDGWERWQRPTRDNPLIRLEGLDSIRHDPKFGGPRAFAQEYEAQFTEEEGAAFPVEYFGDSIWFDEWPRTDATSLRVIACDPSLGKTETADYSALVSLARSDDAYYVSADLERRPPSKIVDDALNQYRQFKANAIGFETVGFQQLLKDEFDRIVDAERMEVWSLAIPNGPETGKRRRILTLDALLEQGRIKFHRDQGTEMLVDQLRGFPLPKYHDDGPDALEMVVRLCDDILEGRVIDRGPAEERVYA